MMNEGRSNNDVLIGFLFGAAVGAAVAILYAPAAGDETRRRMAETAKRFGSATKDKFGELRETVTNLNQVSRQLNHFVEDISRRPYRLLTGVKPVRDSTKHSDPPPVTARDSLRP